MANIFAETLAKLEKEKQEETNKSPFDFNIPEANNQGLPNILDQKLANVQNKEQQLRSVTTDSSGNIFDWESGDKVGNIHFQNQDPARSENLANLATGQTGEETTYTTPRSRGDYVKNFLDQAIGATANQVTNLATEGAQYLPFAGFIGNVQEKVIKATTGEDVNIGKEIRESIQNWSEQNLSGEELRVARESDLRIQNFRENKTKEKEKRIAEGMSPLKAEALQQIDEAKFILGEFKEDPSRAMNMIAQTLPSMFVGIGAASLRARSVFSKLDSKFGKNWRNNPQAIKEATTALGTTAALADAGFEGVSAGAEARDKVLNMKQEDLEKSPVYAALRKQGYSSKEAQDILADQVAVANMALSSTIVFATSKVTGVADVQGAIGGLLRKPKTDRYQKSVVEQLNAAVGKTAGSATNVGLREGGQEALQTGLQTGSSNLIEQRLINPEQSITESVGTNIASGAVAGGAIGGAVGGASGATSAATDFRRTPISDLRKSNIKGNLKGLQPEVREALDRIGMDFTVTSGVREGHKGAHGAGLAVDISVAGWTDEQKAELFRRGRQEGFNRFIVYDNSDHVQMDMKKDQGDFHVMYSDDDPTVASRSLYDQYQERCK